MGQNQQKFLTAETTTKVAAPEGVLENSPEFLQYGISSIMPESIIHLFEVIQVSQGHPKGKTMSSGAAELGRSPVFNSAAVRQSGKSVGECKAFP